MYILGTNEIGQTPCVRIIDGNTITSIPMDEANTDYQAFLLWKSQGNEPLPADA